MLNKFDPYLIDESRIKSVLHREFHDKLIVGERAHSENYSLDSNVAWHFLEPYSFDRLCHLKDLGFKEPAGPGQITFEMDGLSSYLFQYVKFWLIKDFPNNTQVGVFIMEEKAYECMWKVANSEMCCKEKEACFNTLMKMEKD